MTDHDHDLVPCPTCGVPGPAGRRFCTTCGTPRTAPPLSPPEPPTVTLAVGCATCGAAFVPGKKFCGGCGTANPPEVAGAVSLHKPPTGPPRVVPASAPATTAIPLPVVVPTVYVAPSTAASRRRGGLLVAVLLVLLLAGGGVAGYLVVSGDDAPSAADRATDGRSDDTGSDNTGSDGEDDAASAPAATVTVTAGESDDPSAEPSTGPSATATADPLVARCWDGTRERAVSQCPAPTGAAGLRWIAPGFDFAGENCIMRPVRLAPTHRFHYNCPSDGSDNVWFNFSEFDTNDWGRIYHEAKAGFASYPDRGFLRWDYSTGRGEYKTALLYEGARWGVTIYSYDVALRDETARNLLRRFRPASELRGLPG